MLRPPPLKFAVYYPVTAGVSLAAIVVTCMWHFGNMDIDAFAMDNRVWNEWQLWRPLAATLPHAGFFHIAFNLYWLWTFGTLVERVYGHFKCAAIYVLLAFGSMLGDFAVLNGGVGLSGVGYGLWGMIMMLERHDPRFMDAVDRQTNQLFVGWFFLCIVLTIANIMPVANVAHGVGAVLGILLGLAIAGNGAVKWRSRAGLVALMVLILLGGTVFWPYVNLSKYARADIENAALTDLDHKQYARAVQLLQIAAHKRNAPAHTWYNLGVAYERVGKFGDAMAVIQHAASMPDADDQIMRAAQGMEGNSPSVKTNR